jgi:L-cysteine:1D-myo-inositol 2-amino-2-deoxy-alpha-D-glucopyranoside ligase
MAGHKVSYVQNVTDIDDDILKKAKEIGEDWRDLGNRWTLHFIEDMKTLNVRPPDFYPRATEVIPKIIQDVSNLLDCGVAYQQDGNVYFDIHQWPEFGNLSRLSLKDMLPIANERGNNPDDPHKHDPLDFVLWQAGKTGEPTWESPWGLGRPGWHIECSSMATQFLGETIDIHSGGADLLFPHHECEIAQVVPITGKPSFARFWLHIAMVYYQGEKMSKSLGNLVMIRDLIKKWTPDTIRIYLAMHHYREPWSHDESRLRKAQETVTLLVKAVEAPGGDSTELDLSGYRDSFVNSLANDLDTPAGLEVLETMAAEILSAGESESNVTEAQNQLRKLSSVLGVRLDQSPAAEVVSGWDQHRNNFI